MTIRDVGSAGGGASEHRAMDLTLNDAADALAKRREEQDGNDRGNDRGGRRGARDESTGRFQPKDLANEPVTEDAGEEPDIDVSEVESEPTTDRTIDPPSSWAQHKDQWSKLSPEVQEIISGREKERETGIEKELGKTREQRSTFETESKQTQQARLQLEAALKETQSIMMGGIARDFPGFNPQDPMAMSRLADADPAAYLRLQARLGELQKIINATRAVDQQKEVESTKTSEEFQAKRREQLLEMDKTLADPKNAEKFENDVVSFLTSDGFTLDDIKGLNAKALIIVRDAKRYRDAVSKAKSKPKGQATRPLRSGSPAGSEQTTSEAAQKKIGTAQDQLRKSGTLTDAVSLYRARKTA